MNPTTQNTLRNEHSHDWKTIMYHAANRNIPYFEWNGQVYKVIYNPHFEGPGSRDTGIKYDELSK